MGSKSRIAKHIVPIIQKYVDEVGVYWEPFCGGCNVIDKIRCNEKYASDKNKYLIALLQHVQSGGNLLNTVSKELYDKARTQYNRNQIVDFENWEIGNIGFLASYNGRFFDGGYAKSGYEKTSHGERFRDYYREASRNLLEQSPNLRGIVFSAHSYTDKNPVGMVIYCDPPYANTKEYKNALDFDYDLFWDTMRKWSENNVVLISEENAPEDFDILWCGDVSRSIKSADKSVSTEKLFIYNNKKNIVSRKHSASDLWD